MYAHLCILVRPSCGPRLWQSTNTVELERDSCTKVSAGEPEGFSGGEWARAVGQGVVGHIDLQDFEPTPGPQMLPPQGVCAWGSIGMDHVVPLLLWERRLAQAKLCVAFSAPALVMPPVQPFRMHGVGCMDGRTAGCLHVWVVVSFPGRAPLSPTVQPPLGPFHVSLSPPLAPCVWWIKVDVNGGLQGGGAG